MLDTYPIRIRGGYAPDAYPRRIGVSPSESAWKLALRYVSEGGIRPISIPPPGLPDALQNRTRRHSVCPHARGRRSRGRLAARRRRATGDEPQPLEKLLPPARRRLAAGPAGGGQARSEKGEEPRAAGSARARGRGEGGAAAITRGRGRGAAPPPDPERTGPARRPEQEGRGGGGLALGTGWWKKQNSGRE